MALPEDLASLGAAVRKAWADIESAQQDHVEAAELFRLHRIFNRATLDYQSRFNGQASGGTELDMVIASSATRKPVHWLWHPYIPRGFISLLSGDPGVGKSQFLLWLASHITTGKPLPGHTTLGDDSPIGNVVIVAGEDAIEEVLLPRAEAAGCDLKRLAFVKGLRTEEGKPRDFNIADADVLSTFLAKHEDSFLLIAIDPIQHFMPKGTNANNMGEVRDALRALPGLAERHQAAFLLTRHRGKDRAKAAIHQGHGSVDFTGIARSEIAIAIDDDDAEEVAWKKRRVACHVKANLGPTGQNFTLTIEQVRLLDPICDTSRIRWEGSHAGDINDILSGLERRTFLREAQDFIVAFLSQGPRASADLAKAAQDEKINSATLMKAKTSLKLRVTRRENRVWLELNPQLAAAIPTVPPPVG